MPLLRWERHHPLDRSHDVGDGHGAPEDLLEGSLRRLVRCAGEQDHAGAGMPGPEAVEEIVEQLRIARGERFLVEEDQAERIRCFGAGAQRLQQVARTGRVVSRLPQFGPEEGAGPLRRYYDEDTGWRHLLIIASLSRRGNGLGRYPSWGRIMTIARRWRRSRIALAAGAAAVLAGACSDRAGGDGAGRGGAERARAALAQCPDEQFISSTIGFTVHLMPRAASQPEDGVLLCAYQAAERQVGAFISIAAAPLTPGEDALAEVRSAAAAISGADGTDSIGVGERGYAYGSASKSAAAAVRASRVYHVDVTATRPIGDRKAAVIAILRKVVG